MRKKRRSLPLAQQPAFKRLKERVSRPGQKDLLWHYEFGHDVNDLYPVTQRKYGKSQIEELARKLGQKMSFAQRMWSARRFATEYSKQRVKTLNKARRGSS